MVRQVFLTCSWKCLSFLLFTFIVDTKYDFNDQTRSGLYVKNVELSDEGYYGVKINFENSAVVFSDIVYFTVVSKWKLGGLSPTLLKHS